MLTVHVSAVEGRMDGHDYVVEEGHMNMDDDDDDNQVLLHDDDDDDDYRNNADVAAGKEDVDVPT